MKRVLWITAAVLIATGLAAFFSRNTYALYLEQQRSAQESDYRMRKAEADRGKLLTEKAKLETPAGKEELGRKMGYRRPNERDLSPGR